MLKHFIQAQDIKKELEWKHHAELHKRLLDYDTFLKRNNLKFTLGRLRNALANTRKDFFDHFKTELREYARATASSLD